MTRQRIRGESGSALVEITWLGLLLLIPLVYFIVTIFTVQRSAFGATAAVRSAGRAYTLSPDVATAGKRAFRAAQLSLRDQGVELEPGELVIACNPTPDSCLQPGSTVTISIELAVELPLMPTIAEQQLASISVDATHTEPFGIYREASP